MDDYAPRSPDLSALRSLNSYGPSHEKQDSEYQHNNYIPEREGAFTSLPKASYYQEQGHLQSHNPSTFSHPSSYAPPTYHNTQIYQPGLQSLHQAHNPSYIKLEDDWQQQQQQVYSTVPDAASTAASMAEKSSRKVSGKGLGRTELEPRLPAPGDEERIVVKTKFPVARIKRIVQADEEVGKVAQATPVAVGKALELFMIQMTLSAVNEASLRGSKRLAASHIKAAINRDDKFDFLKDIGDKIPDDPGVGRRRGGGENRAKAENGSEDDVEMDPDAKGKRKPRSGKKRRGMGDD